MHHSWSLSFTAGGFLRLFRSSFLQRSLTLSTAKSRAKRPSMRNRAGNSLWRRSVCLHPVNCRCLPCRPPRFRAVNARCAWGTKGLRSVTLVVRDVTWGRTRVFCVRDAGRQHHVFGRCLGSRPPGNRAGCRVDGRVAAGGTFPKRATTHGMPTGSWLTFVFRRYCPL